MKRWMAAAAMAASMASGAALAQATPVTVYKSPTCGCCGKWVEHMKASGFQVKTIEQADVAPVKAKLGVPGKLGSCHTAVIGGYVIEGHVPAGDIRRLLRERPKIAGLSTPGMPQSAPGMDTGSRDHYDVVAFDAKGKTSVFARH